MAVATLAIGIAATASLFALVNGLVLDPLPYPDPDRLVRLGKDVSSNFEFTPLSTPDYLDLRERVTQMAELGSFTVRRFNLGGDLAESDEGPECTAGVLRPWALRHFTAAGSRQKTRAVTQRSSSSVMGSGRDGSVPTRVRSGARSLRTAAITPWSASCPSFQLLSAWTRNRALSVWTLMPLRRGGESRTNYWMASIARLKPDASIAAAGAELRDVSRQMAQENPETNGRRTSG